MTPPPLTDAELLDWKRKITFADGEGLGIGMPMDIASRLLRFYEENRPAAITRDQTILDALRVLSQRRITTSAVDGTLTIRTHGQDDAEEFMLQLNRLIMGDIAANVMAGKLPERSDG